jgi:hypothetical protein
MGEFLVVPQEDKLAVHAGAGWLTEGLDWLWVGRHGWWWLGRAACSNRLFLRFGHRPTGGLAGGLLGAGHPLFAVHVSVDQFTWSGHIFEAGSDFGQIGPAVSKKYYNKTYYTILDHYTYLMRKPTSGDSVFGNINKRLIGQWVKPRSVAFIARGFADKRDAFILVRSIVFPKLAFCDSLA